MPAHLVTLQRGSSKVFILCTLASDSPGQLNVFGHDGDPLGMDGTQVGVLKQANKVCFTGFLYLEKTSISQKCNNYILI